MHPTLEGMAEWSTYGRPANVGAANRTKAIRAGDTLLTDSHLGVFPVARREVDEDGTARLVFIDPGREETPAVRFGPEHCVDPEMRDLLCARLRVPSRNAPTTGACGDSRLVAVARDAPLAPEHEGDRVARR